MGYANAMTDVNNAKCPDEAYLAWQYSKGGSWIYAGQGLKVKCTGTNKVVKPRWLD